MPVDISFNLIFRSYLDIYLDLTFIISNNNRLYTKLYDKRDEFNFHIVNFPSGPSYGVYISQPIRYARCCTYYDDFEYRRHKLLVDRLRSQGYKVNRLRNSFQTFMAGIQIWLQSIKMICSLFNTIAVKILSIFMIYRICHLDCHFNTIVAVCDGCRA